MSEQKQAMEDEIEETKDILRESDTRIEFCMMEAVQLIDLYGIDWFNTELRKRI
jgi:tetrahydromethanopterin S-methyltransferase subunit G|tara:strand:- start:888 stop:1049 length:162 start_codon:yes stop_codon:yes gene_type:complete